MPANPHKALAQTAKANKLRDVLVANRRTAQQASEMSEYGWECAAKLAGVNPPSAETRELVITMLRSHERVSKMTEKELFARMGDE